MFGIDLFRFGAAVTVAAAVAAGTIGLLTRSTALGLTALVLAAMTLLIVLADRRMLKTSERRSRETAAALRNITEEVRRDEVLVGMVSALSSELSEIRADATSVRSALSPLQSELRAVRTGLEGLRTELRALRGDLRTLATDVQAAQQQATHEPEPSGAQLDTLRHELQSAVGPVRDALAWAEEQRGGQLRRLEWRIGKLHTDVVTDVQSLHQLFTRYAPGAPLPPLGGWAVSPTALVTVLDFVERRGARTVVECGSGTSTLWIAYALRAVGAGKVVSLEHQPEYVDKTRTLLEAHGVEEWAEVRYAPLTRTETPRGAFEWYSTTATTFESPIDLLLIDGPPGSTGPLARYPALHVLRPHLSPGAVIVADDAEREDEQEIIGYWLEDEPDLTRVQNVGGYLEVLELRS